MVDLSSNQFFHLRQPLTTGTGGTSEVVCAEDCPGLRQKLTKQSWKPIVCCNCFVQLFQMVLNSVQCSSAYFFLYQVQLSESFWTRLVVIKARDPWGKMLVELTAGFILMDFNPKKMPTRISRMIVPWCFPHNLQLFYFSIFGGARMRLRGQDWRVQDAPRTVSWGPNCGSCPGKLWFSLRPLGEL